MPPRWPPTPALGGLRDRFAAATGIGGARRAARHLGTWLPAPLRRRGCCCCGGGGAAWASPGGGSRRRVRACRSSRSPVERLVLFWRWSWVLLVLYGEFLAFFRAAWTCRWPARDEWQPPDSSSSSVLPSEPSAVTHVAVIADPQLTDRASYRQSGWALRLTEYYTDYYMLRSERALRFVNRPDAFFLLGDLLDGGRELDQEEWTREIGRLKTVFPLVSTPADDASKRAAPPVYVIGGNHDFGLGDTVVPGAWSRFRKLFGPTTRRFEVGNHTVVVVDSVALAGLKHSRGVAAVAEVEDLLAKMTSDKSDPQNRILLTHIPLYRPPSATCGPLRTSSTRISNSRGYQYQNLLDREWTRKILGAVKPALVLSGDDHDFCEQAHERPGYPDAMEYTIPTFSFAQGNFQPQVGLLSLNTEATVANGGATPSWALSTCPMVHQWGVYVIYVITLLATLISVCARSSRARRARPEPRHVPSRSLLGSEDEGWPDPDNDDGDAGDLPLLERVVTDREVPPPPSPPPRTRTGWWQGVLSWPRRASPGFVGLVDGTATTTKKNIRRRGSLWNAAGPLLRIAWPPLLLYAGIAVFWRSL